MLEKLPLVRTSIQVPNSTSRLIGAALLVAGTTIIFTAASSATQEKVWRHGLIKAKADAGILLMVTTRDFAKKQGLKIETKEFPNGQLALMAMIAGEVDSYESGPGGAFSADSKGADARILGCHWVVVPHGIYAKDTIKTVAGLKGKMIAVSAPNSMPNMLARFALAKYGLSFNDVKVAAVGGDRGRYQALVGGVVDAAVVSNEVEPIAPKTIHMLVAGRDAVPKFLRLCIMSNAKTLAVRGDDAVKFLAAEMSALRYALSHRDETVALTQKIIHAKPNDPRPAFVYDDTVKHHAVDPTLPLPADKLNWLQAQLVKAGKLTAPLDLNTVTAPQFRKRALKMVGRTH
jgi:NitT/TauT family transport system substrate-binding protein